jgi:hypothetical protein
MMTWLHREKRRQQTPLVPCLLGVLLLGCACLTAAGRQPVADPKFTPPPGEETPEVRGLIDQGRAALKSGRTVTELLTDGTFMPARPWPRFRALVRAQAPTGAVTLVPASEPGDLLHVRGTIRDADGQPMKGALLYVYHTSAKGWYSDKAAHIAGNSGDVKHARLFAYLKTDAAGRYEFRTIRPGGYPATDLPAHIHVHIEAAGGRPRSYGTEIRFDDDPRLTREWRERSRREGYLICPVKREGDTVRRVVADFQFR